jgi:hypothetical protein
MRVPLARAIEQRWGSRRGLGLLDLDGIYSFHSAYATNSLASPTTVTAATRRFECFRAGTILLNALVSGSLLATLDEAQARDAPARD